MSDTKTVEIVIPSKHHGDITVQTSMRSGVSTSEGVVNTASPRQLLDQIASRLAEKIARPGGKDGK